MTHPDWAQPGKTVAVVTDGPGRTDIYLADVQRVTPTQVIVGKRSVRFKANGDGVYTLPRDAWGPRVTIMAVDSPFVVRVRAERRVENTYYDLFRALKDLAAPGPWEQTLSESSAKKILDLADNMLTAVEARDRIYAEREVTR